MDGGIERYPLVRLSPHCSPGVIARQTKGFEQHPRVAAQATRGDDSVDRHRRRRQDLHLGYQVTRSMTGIRDSEQRGGLPLWAEPGPHHSRAGLGVGRTNRAAPRHAPPGPGPAQASQCRRVAGELASAGSRRPVSMSSPTQECPSARRPAAGALRSSALSQRLIQGYFAYSVMRAFTGSWRG